jgi:hypothetical protein
MNLIIFSSISAPELYDHPHLFDTVNPSKYDRLVNPPRSHEMRYAFATVIGLVLLAPCATFGDEATFQAKVEAADLLDSKEVAVKIQDCTAKADPAPDHVDLEVAVDAEGEIAGLALAPALSEEIRACVRDALDPLGFPAVADGFTVNHRIAIERTDEPEPVEETAEAEPEPEGFSDPDPTRIVYAQTAIPREEGVFNATVHDLGYWVLDYGVHQNVALGLKLVLPIGIVAFMPNLRTGFQVGEKVWLGGSVNYTFLMPYVDDSAGEFYLMTYGGTLSLSVGSDTFLFNFAFTSQGVTILQQDDPMTNEGLFLPQLGASIRLHEKVKLNLELAPPLTTDADYMEDYGGRMWIAMYGIRIHGDYLYGDISFVWPIFEDAWEFMKYLPMGMPLLSFGFQVGGGDDGEGD